MLASVSSSPAPTSSGADSFSFLVSGFSFSDDDRAASLEDFPELAVSATCPSLGTN